MKTVKRQGQQMKCFNRQIARSPDRQIRSHRNAGVAAILAMMFLVIFASLAAAMAIVAQGNLATADSYIKMNRALAAAETGMKFVQYNINQNITAVQTTAGVINTANAPALWTSLSTALQASLANAPHNLAEPTLVGTTLTLGPIAVGPGEPTFTATLTPHPLAGENYSSSYYQRPPYNTMAPAVSAAAPLDCTWIRVKVVASDGVASHAIERSIQMDFKLDKKIKFAVLSRSRIMIGRNVMISGPIGSRFTETNLANGHPVQMVSDFYGLDATLDASLNTFYNTLKTNDKNGDNRIDLSNAAETAGITNPAQYDTNHDGYIDEYDFFLARFDANGDGKVSNTELNTASNVNAAQLMQLVDTFGDPTRQGYNDGFIDNNDRYAKIQGQIMIKADLAGWQAGAAGGNYQNYVQGPIIPNSGQTPITFQASDAQLPPIDASDFDVSSFAAMATGNLASQAAAQAAQYSANNPNSPQPLGNTVYEAMPYGAAHPYDYYTRPVYTNMTFNNVTIPPGTNALFQNCTFTGCTFVQTSNDNNDPNYNYAGTQAADGSATYPGLTATVNGATVADTKPLSNNIRFDGCTFNGAVVTAVAPTFTNARNKVSFTGSTTFNPTSSSLTASQQALFQRSTLMAPNYSVEMGTFVSPTDPTQALTLTGTIVAGVIDMRGQINVNGSILTTFEPKSNTNPVLGNTSPNFNTTLGYFPSSAGDLEAEMPATGVGVIKIRYNPNLALPDGIMGPIQLTPNVLTYFEGG